MRSLDRSAAFWLRAYTPAWRARRADEVTAVLVDLAPDGARSLDLRTVLGLLRGGVATRWRQTPPLRVYLPYRLLDVRVPPQYREWVRQDIASPGALRRNLTGRLWLFVLPLWNALASDTRGDTLAMWTVLTIALTATLLCVRPGSVVRRRLQRHARTSPPVVGSWVWVRTSRARVAAEPGAQALVLLLTVGAVAWSTAAVLAPTRLGSVPCDAAGALACSELVVVPRDHTALITAPLTAALLAGVGLAVAVRRRLARHLADRPEQPARQLVGLAPHAGPGLALWVGLILAGATAEATGTWALSLSALAAPACLLLLPTAAVLWLLARTTPGCAFVDLRHVAWTGRPVEVDRYDTDLIPAADLVRR
ncbi:hypothetical protein [Cellulomonas terrae]|uniref:Uncharacterized protein n=1 Tax=Cellulomonas terrae TaxID=311234 RepID=A0A511JIU9_9CELL|nr:hypothetical protein [Cellulomonas terrae]GEL97931.1 hypothetical protein CTE05_14780 [Cellulomonas terrae]